MHRHGCWLVQEFDAREFLAPAPADPRAPFVDKIDIELRERKR
jgi:hypothetical protein